MKRLFLVLSLFFFAISLWGAVSTVTYSSKTNLGDGVVYLFTWTSTGTADVAWVGGRDGDGFLVANMNDKQITIELYSDEGTAANVDWEMHVYGNHEADSDTSNWYLITTEDVKNKTLNQVTLSAATVGNSPYLMFEFAGDVDGDTNAAGQSITLRVYFDYDEKYIGKE